MSYFTQNEGIRNTMCNAGYKHITCEQGVYEKKNVISVSFDGKFIDRWVIDESWDTESYDLAENLLWACDEMTFAEAKSYIYGYTDSPCDHMALEDPWAGGSKDSQKKTYVKISKNEGKSYIDLHIQGMIKKIGLSVDYLKQIASLDYNKTSARLFKGYYICPMSLAFELGKRLGINKADAVALANEWLAGV